MADPGDDERGSALHAMEAARARRAVLAVLAVLAAERHLPARTLDDHPVVVRANVATPAVARATLTAHADGVGLLRTELPFLHHRAWPTRAQHTAALVPVLRPPAALDEVRARVRRLHHGTCATTATAALALRTPEDVWRLAERHCLPPLP
ncbi:putative PEP-binding protein [Streptomyces sp. NPDC020996]|uniref:putative PEP-binding protein n=1 Tax=Streptomyces sp. NPDC020996 TaxID=3154791 RepID=UPI0033D40EA2